MAKFGAFAQYWIKLTQKHRQSECGPAAHYFFTEQRNGPRISVKGPAQKFGFGLKEFVIMVDKGAQATSETIEHGLGLKGPLFSQTGRLAEAIPMAQTVRHLVIVI